MTHSRIIPKLRIATASGSDPDVVAVDDIDSCDLVYQPSPNHLTFDLEDLPRSCPRNADGLHCVYEDASHPDRCIYCGEVFAL